METFKCLDYSQMEYPVGMLVQRSEFYQQSRCKTGRPQVGVITEFKIFTNDDEMAVVWPVVAWEDIGTGPSTTNPALVDVYRARDKKKAKYIEICP